MSYGSMLMMLSIAGLFVGIAGVLFLTTRFLMLWYWRVNTVVNELRKTNELLTEIIANQERASLLH